MTNLVIGKIKRTLKGTGYSFIAYKSFTFSNNREIVNALVLPQHEIAIEFSEWITVYNLEGKVIDCIDSSVSDEVAIFRIALDIAR